MNKQIENIFKQYPDININEFKFVIDDLEELIQQAIKKEKNICNELLAINHKTWKKELKEKIQQSKEETANEIIEMIRKMNEKMGKHLFKIRKTKWIKQHGKLDRFVGGYIEAEYDVDDFLEKQDLKSSIKKKYK